MMHPWLAKIAMASSHPPVFVDSYSSHIIRKRRGMENDFRVKIIEVLDAGKAADVTSYSLSED
jgi:hypothetical protein